MAYRRTNAQRKAQARRAKAMWKAGVLFRTRHRQSPEEKVATTLGITREQVREALRVFNEQASLRQQKQSSVADTNTSWNFDEVTKSCIHLSVAFARPIYPQELLDVITVVKSTS